jgi:hypothetical protein
MYSGFSVPYRNPDRNSTVTSNHIECGKKWEQYGNVHFQTEPRKTDHTIRTIILFQSDTSPQLYVSNSPVIED